LAVVTDEMIEERRRLGLDRRDEMWDGVLHLVPVASSAHGILWYELTCLFAPKAHDQGLRCMAAPGVFDPQDADMVNFRVPDLGYARSEDVTERGIEGRAVLVVEVLSTCDEAHDKLPFYRQVGVEELLYVDSTTKAFEVRRPEGKGWALVDADDDGWTWLASLGAALCLVDGRLQVRTPLGIEEV